RSEDGRWPGGHVAARPGHAAALAPPRPDRPHSARPADRKGRAADPRPDPPRWLATGGHPDPRTGQGGAIGTLPEFRGFPPVARNPPQIRTHTPYRSPALAAA